MYINLVFDQTGYSCHVLINCYQRFHLQLNYCTAAAAPAAAACCCSCCITITPQYLPLIPTPKPRLNFTDRNCFSLFPTPRLFKTNHRESHPLPALQPSDTSISYIQPFSLRLQTWTQHWDSSAENYKRPSILSWPGKGICSNFAWSISFLWHTVAYHSPKSWTYFWHTRYCSAPVLFLPLKTKTVFVKTCRSAPLLVCCGVLHGSVLGPVLFVLYTRALCDLTGKHSVHHHLLKTSSCKNLPRHNSLMKSSKPCKSAPRTLSRV